MSQDWGLKFQCAYVTAASASVYLHLRVHTVFSMDILIQNLGGTPVGNDVIKVAWIKDDPFTHMHLVRYTRTCGKKGGLKFS